MPRVLIVTYYFPPRPGVASVRLGGLAKYLPEFGWEPVILTARLPGSTAVPVKIFETDYVDVIGQWKRRFGFRPDANIHEELGIDWGPQARSGVRDRIMKLFREAVAFPDEHKGWFHYAVKAADEIVKGAQLPPDVILSSSGPPTAHIIANHISVRYGIPWVADFRDLWTQNHYNQYSDMRRWLERRLELRTLGRARALVTISTPLADQLHTLHAKLPVYVITNGFDPDELAPVGVTLSEKFTITHTGSLYDGKRDPSPLLRVVKDLIVKGIMDRTKVEFRFYGPKQPWLERIIKENGLEDIAKQYGIVSRQEALQRQREAHILLLLTWNDPAEEGVYTGKVFEYLAARRPILAVGKAGGVLQDLLTETGAGVVAEDERYLKRIILKSYEQYRATSVVAYRVNPEAVSRYSHREMARKFSRIFETVLGEHIHSEQV